MKKEFVRVMLFGALTLAVSTTVTSCKGYDDDVKNLQEQIDKITSTSPVSTDDMKTAVEAAKKELQGKITALEALLADKAAQSKLESEVARLEKAIADAQGAAAADLAKKLADTKNELQTLINAKADASVVAEMKEQVTKMDGMLTTLSALIDAESKYKANGDISGYKGTGFDAYINQSILDAISDTDPDNKGAIASYVTTAIQSAISADAKTLNDHIASLTGSSIASLEAFIDKVYNDLYSEDGAIKKKLDTLDNLLAAIDAYVGTGDGKYADYAAIIKQIDDTKKQLATLNLPDGKTFDEAVKSIISEELNDVTGVVKTLETKLQKEIDAIKGMIQSIVYIPEAADRTVNFNTFYAKFGTVGNEADWSSVVNAKEVQVKFRVSPASAVAELVKGDAGKYKITTDYQALTRATGAHFKVSKVEAVADEPNVIAVTLDASTAAKSYAVALTVQDNAATTLNDITSDYFAAVKENLYIDVVKWESASNLVAQVARGASIDYKAEGSYYKMTVKTEVNGSGVAQGTTLSKTKPEEFGISVDDLFSVAFTMTGSSPENNFTLDAKTGVLTGKPAGALGGQCTVHSTVTVKKPASVTGSDVTYTAADYTLLTLVDVKTPVKIALATPGTVSWKGGADNEVALDATTVTAIKTALGIADFSSCSFNRVAPANGVDVPDIKLDKNTGNNLVLKVPDGAIYTGPVTTNIVSSNTSIAVTIDNVVIAYPTEADYTLTNSGAWNGSEAVLNLVETGNSPITAVTAVRNLQELFSNYAALNTELGKIGGAFAFSIDGGTPTGVTLNASTGMLTIGKTYDGPAAGFSVKVEAKCGSKVISTKKVPVVFDAAKMNGTFDYVTAGEPASPTTTLAFDVTSAATRGNGVDVTKALVWNDASKRQLWPTSGASSDYTGSNGASVFGFGVKFVLEAGADNASFTLNPNTGAVTFSEATNSQNTVPRSVKVKAVPSSPWGAVASKVVTVTVATWQD